MIIVFLVVWLVLCTECTEAVANNRESESCSCSCLNDQLMELLQGYHNDTVSILNDYLKCRDLHEEELLRRKRIGENLSIQRIPVMKWQTGSLWLSLATTGSKRVD